MVSNRRESGSTAEFHREWVDALSHSGDRRFIYPNASSNRQFDLFEWIKAKQIDTILQQCGLDKGNLLEYGCGAAGISIYLAGKGYSAHICDISSAAIQVAQQNQMLNQPDTKFSSTAVADVSYLPYPDGFFDVVMSYGLLEHFETDSLDQLMKETLRVLKPGGLFLVDIIPGPEQVNVRSVGLLASFLGSYASRLLHGRWKDLGQLRTQYFEPYHETAYSDQEWGVILGRYGLQNIQVEVCRPFPPLAISGRIERLYSRAILKMLPFHQRFDRSQNWLTRRWGWMYLAWGCKA